MDVLNMVAVIHSTAFSFRNSTDLLYFALKTIDR